MRGCDRHGEYQIQNYGDKNFNLKYNIDEEKNKDTMWGCIGL